MSNLSISLTRTVIINIIGPVEPCLFPLNENILQHFNFLEPSVLSWYYFAWKQIRQILCAKLEILRTSIKKSSLFCSFLGERYYALYVTCTCKCIHKRLVLKSCPPAQQESITLYKIIYHKYYRILQDCHSQFLFFLSTSDQTNQKIPKFGI